MDDEIKGEGNSVNYKYRMHDPRLGRFFAIDPLASDYPWNSSYAFSENIVINAVELEGLEKIDVYNQWYDEKGKFHKKFSHTEINYALVENVNLYNTYNAYGKVGHRLYTSQESNKKYVAPVGQVSYDMLYKMFRGAAAEVPNKKDPTYYSGWEGASSGANDPGTSSRDIAVGGGIIATIGAVVTASPGAFPIAVTTITIANGVDDVFTDGQGRSGLVQTFSKNEETLKFFKTVGYMFTLTSGGIVGLTKPSETNHLINSISMTLDTYSIVSSQTQNPSGSVSGYSDWKAKRDQDNTKVVNQGIRQ